MNFLRRGRPSEAPDLAINEPEPEMLQETSVLVESAEYQPAERSVFTDVLTELEPSIQNLGRTWQAAREVINNALHSPESQAAYGRALVATIPEDLHLTHGDKTRQTEKILKKELPTGVSIAVITARTEARDMVRGGLQTLPDHPLLHQRAQDIAPQQRAIFVFERDLCKKLIPTFSRAESLTGEVVDAVATYVGSSLEAANEFVDWLQSSGNEEKQRLQPLLAALASDVVDPSSQHKLERAFSAFREADRDILVEEFVEMEMDSGKRAQTLMDMAIYAARLLESRTGIQHDPRVLLLETVVDWPENVTMDYRDFKKEYLDDAWKVVTEQLNPFNSKMQRIPTEKDVAELLERRRPSEKAVGVRALRGARVTQGSVVSTDFIRTEQSEVKTRRTLRARLATIVRTEGGKSELAVDQEVKAKESMDQMIAAYSDRYPHDKTLKSDLQRMVDSILLDPYGRGTINIDDGKTLVVNGKEVVKPRRLQPVKRPGLSVGSIAKSTRITYYPVKSPGSEPLNVVIEGIRDHDEYMRWIS